MGKKKSIYQEGYLCLFDKKGEMFFRTVTHAEELADDWDIYVDYRIVGHEQSCVFDNDITTNDEFSVEARGKSCLLDTPTLWEYDEEENDFAFKGHFELEPRKKKGWNFSFGSIYMTDGHEYNPDTCRYEYVMDEVKYAYHELCFNIEEHTRRLRVVLD